jgi:hypothetical protein
MAGTGCNQERFVLHEPIGVDKETPVDGIRKEGLRIGSKSCPERSV